MRRERGTLLERHKHSRRELLGYPIRESDLIIKPFDVPSHWPRAYGLDVGWRSTGAIWGALDPLSAVLYLYSEYCSTDRQTAVHAQAIRSRGVEIPGFMDPVGSGRNQMDGYRFMQLYRESGLKLEPASNLVESGIVEVWQRMSTGRLKVFPTLTHFLEELRSYRRDDKGQGFGIAFGGGRSQVEPIPGMSLHRWGCPLENRLPSAAPPLHQRRADAETERSTVYGGWLSIDLSRAVRIDGPEQGKKLLRDTGLRRAVRRTSRYRCAGRDWPRSSRGQKLSRNVNCSSRALWPELRTLRMPSLPTPLGLPG